MYGLRKDIFTDIIKTHGFQYKLMHNILVNNYWPEKWKLENIKCTFCETGIENILQLFWECDFKKTFD